MFMLIKVINIYERKNECKWILFYGNDNELYVIHVDENSEEWTLVQLNSCQT